MLTVEQQLKAIEDQKEQGNWLVACGGQETPFRKGHYTYIYLWQPSTNKHAYYCFETDLILTDEQALNWLN